MYTAPSIRASLPVREAAGFTIIESVVCVLILASSVLGIFVLFHQIGRMNQFAAQLTEATALAEDAALPFSR